MAENTNPATPPAGETGQPPARNPPSDPPKGQEPKVFDEEYVKTLRSEAAGYRTRATAAEAELQKQKDAQLSEVERAKKEATDAQARAKELEANLRTQ